MKNTLYVFMGIPGSGKTTLAKKSIGITHVSRDNIRFSLIDKKDNYFSKEKQVYKEFIRQINENITEGKAVIADATHLNLKSRYKLFHALHIDRTKTTIVGIYFKIPLETCLSRNETRKGTLAYVPPHEIHNMYTRLEPPTYNEPFDYIYTFDGINMNLLERK